MATAIAAATAAAAAERTDGASAGHLDDPVGGLGGEHDEETEEEPATASNGSTGGHMDFTRMDRLIPTGPPYVCPVLSRVDGTPCNKARAGPGGPPF